MSSNSAQAFRKARDRARLLVAAAGRPTSNSQASDHKETCLHAALAMLVAAWEAYLEQLIVETQRTLTDPTHLRLTSVLSLLSAISLSEIKKFNTPNANNSRNLLFIHTGFDPLNAWLWSAGGLNAVQTRQRLDEILRVRHCFAHGASIPLDIQWAKDRNSPGHLNKTVLQMTDRFLSYLVEATDGGMATYVASTYGLPTPW